ncbi:uncharacterized protein N7459_007986 [Penicillium hispanicum]|uniref:uncharacterized protein n=1 Tax=Penicillium hispanicum TaxID=1080232 RepID=UPI0025402074|nr:uncharacterized protein N7459_007986 [Penicillium hispanicum]KAJ5573559.1 hypothetical protein N7459_007986 [Penicillium hispanicum]
MFLRSILLGGTAALGASAVLVVPEMEPQVEETEDGLMSIRPFMLEDTTRAAVGVPCTECPFRTVHQEGAVTWNTDKPSTLMLDFSIVDDLLLANGHQIFPPDAPSPISAIQQLEDGQVSEPASVGYALEVMPVAFPSDEPGAALLDVRFTVLDLYSQPVIVDTVAIKLIQDVAGNLHIARTDIEKSAPAPEGLSGKDCEGKAKCLRELLIARIRGLLAAAKERILSMAGKAGRKGCKHKGGKSHKGSAAHVDGGFRGPPPDESFDREGMPPVPEFEVDAEPFHPGPEGHPHHHHHGGFDPEHADHPHHPHHMHGPHGALAHTFSRVVRFILVPAVLGVLAGLTASAVGMLVGQAVVFVWQRYRGTKPQEHKAAWEQGDACEKQGLMTESSVPGYNEETSQTRGSMEKN